MNWNPFSPNLADQKAIGAAADHVIPRSPPWSEDNPRPWDSNHVTLKEPMAPHETSAVMRMFRVGWLPIQIQKALGMFPTEIKDRMSLAQDDEQEADRQGRPIWDEKLPKGMK